ncbi:nuclear transcription factor Y subunit beta-like, partial [Stegodyphus dumicola]|uniref:nuclear transcription factor Y subunit beta-like n=1 Tax=Stegodyphus dumicola TaxID=202533 RepID=UPI0015A77F39
MADENHTQMLIQQQPPPPQQQNQMQQSQLQQQQMQPQQQMQQQPQQQAQAMSMGNTSDQQASHMNVTTSVPINVATINVSQAQQMQTMQQNVNTSSGTTVQMVPQLTAQAQTVQTGNMMSQSSGPHPTMIHPTMTMAQSPLQQVQVIQQPLSASYLQHLYPQQQMLFPGNLTLQHAGMTTPIQNLGATQGLSLQLQAKTTLDAKTSVGGQALQAVNTSNKGMAVNAGTMMTASGQVVGTTPKSNFPQQMMTTPGKSTIIHSQSGFAPANANQTVVIGQLGVLPNQQSIFNHKALADSQKGKTY